MELQAVNLNRQCCPATAYEFLALGCGLFWRLPGWEVSQRLGVSTHSLYAWKRKFAKASSGETEKDAEIRRLKRELTRVTEERDIRKKATAYFARDAK